MAEIISLASVARRVQKSPKITVVKNGHDPHKDLTKKLRSEVSKTVTAVLRSLIREGVVHQRNMARISKNVAQITSVVQSSLREQVEKYSRSVTTGGILRVASGDEIILPATSGEEMIGTSSDIFYSIDPHCRSFGCNVSSKPTPEMKVRLYDLIADANNFEIFESFSASLDKLCLTQGQIRAYAMNHCDMFFEKGHTLFLFKVNTEFFVANIIRTPFNEMVSDGRPSLTTRLRLVITQYTHSRPLLASHHHRVVVPCRGLR